MTTLFKSQARQLAQQKRILTTALLAALSQLPTQAKENVYQSIQQENYEMAQRIRKAMER